MAGKTLNTTENNLLLTLNQPNKFLEESLSRQEQYTELRESNLM